MCEVGLTWQVPCCGRCRGVHTQEEKTMFAYWTKFMAWKRSTPCPFCVNGCCRYGKECRRGLRQDSDYGESSDGEGEDTHGGCVDLYINDVHTRLDAAFA